MQQNVALADGGEEIRDAAQRGRSRRDERRVAQFGGMIAVADRQELRRAERAINDVEIVLGEVEGLEQLRRSCGQSVSISSRTAAPLRRLQVQSFQQVAGLFPVM
jgi:hypothetical protein